MVDFPVVPKRTALVNVDMQSCFVEGSPVAAPEGLAILERINRLAVACRQSDILVIHTRGVFRSDGSNIGVLGEFDPAVRAIRTGILKQGSPAAALHPGLVVEAGDIILEKPRFGAFQSTDLQLILRARGIDTLMITGIATNICCETTAREAAGLDFRVFFLSDGTATFPIGDLSARDLQKATCATLGRAFGQVLTVNDMIKKIERAAHTTAAQA